MVTRISLLLLFLAAGCAAQIVVNPSGGGTAGPTGPTGPAGAIAANAEAAGPLVQDSSFCPVYARTLTSGTALITLNTPIAGCWISVQNNTASTFTVNGVTNSITVNGSVQNLTQPGCTDLTKACPGVIVKANGTTSWDVSGWSVGPAGATGSTGATGATGPTGPSVVIATGTATLGTSAIASAACATVVTVAATGTLTTSNIVADFNADPTGTTGYIPSASGTLTIIKYPTANNVNFKVCNNTSALVTPGAAITLNWKVY